jgi:mono/diheme cytochrome c family protein
MKRCLLLAPVILLLGCGDRIEHYTLPDQITEFTALYDNNCAGCHGRDGRNGAARPLNDPVFLAVIGKQTLKDVIASGVPRTAMPAFAQNAGGALTDQQIAILADQIEQRWSRPQDFAPASVPAYRADLGDPKAGEAVFRKHCAKCHGEDGARRSIAGSVADPSFLALVSDQSLRTTVIAGRSDRGMPDWRKHSPALTQQDVSDVVAWISSRRAPVMMTKRGTKLP